jgi:hypothetical protein
MNEISTAVATLDCTRHRRALFGGVFVLPVKYISE